MPDGHPLPSRRFASDDGRGPARLPARGRGPAGRERGAVTAELAVALPSVVLMLAMLLATATASINQMRCIDAARAAARAAARDEPTSAVVAIVKSVGPPGAQVTVSGAGDQVVVT